MISIIDKSPNIQQDQELSLFDNIRNEVFNSELFKKAFHTKHFLKAVSTLEDGRLIYINNTLKKIIGVSGDDYQGKKISDLGFYNNIDDRKKFVSTIKKQGFVSEFQIKFNTLKGKTRIGLLSAEKITISKQDCILTTIYDMTEQIQMEQKISIYQKFMENSFIGFAICDVNGKLEYVNRALFTMLGYKCPAEMLHTSAQKYYFESYDKKKYLIIKNQILDKKSWEGEIMIKTRNGQPIPTFQSIFLIFDDKQSPVYIGGLIQDIRKMKAFETKLHESELKFSSFAELSNIGMLTVKNNHVLYVNQSMSEIFGYSQEEIEKWDIQDFLNQIHPEDLERLKKDFSEALNPNTITSKIVDSTYETHYRIFTKENEIKWVHQFLRRDKRSDDIFLYSIFLDKTEQKHAQHALELERERREEERIRSQKIESVGVLAGGIAHDYNNILVSVLGNLELLKFSGQLNNEQQEIYTDLHSAVMRARDLTSQLLTFSKGGSPIKKPESIREIIENTAKFVLRGSKSKYELFFDDPLPPVDIDANQIHQVLNNLIINAHQAMPNGGIIKISAIQVYVNKTDHIPLPSGSYIKIAIQDTGVGIPKKNQTKVFDPYFTTKSNGTGLGLATAYSIVKQHKGYINFVSEPYIGTTFYIYLPVSNKSLDQHHLTANYSEILKNMENPVHILVLDDEKNIHAFFHRIGKKTNLEIEFAFDGSEVLIKYIQNQNQNNPFDVVIMDLIIPGGMGGKETINQLLEIDPNAKVIVSSGYSNDKVLANYKKYGFVDILPKPFTINELIQKIQKVL